MSIFPKYISEIIERHKKIKVQALDRFENRIEITAEGFLARVFQHEIDHLNGIIYLDRLPESKQRLLIEKINKITKQ